MEIKKLKNLPNSAKSIKVIGQGCDDDCYYYKEVGKTIMVGGYFGCMVRECYKVKVDLGAAVTTWL